MTDLQLPLGPDPRTAVLRRMQVATIVRFGRVIRPQNKRRTPEWTLVQGLIGARTKTAASNATTDALLTEYGSWEAVAQVPVEELTDRLHRQSFPAMSAQRLIQCLNAIMERNGSVDLSVLADMTTDAAIIWLESLPGIARKISAQVLNTSTLNRPVMVIEGHHRRIMQRMGIVADRADTLKSYETLMPILPEEWSAADMDEHHLLLKKLGQTLCPPRAVHCGDCPVRPDCRTGVSATEEI